MKIWCSPSNHLPPNILFEDSTQYFKFYNKQLFGIIIFPTVFMISLSNSANPCLTLKRSKEAFHQSTAAFSSLETANKNGSSVYQQGSIRKAHLIEKSQFDPKNLFANISVGSFTDRKLEGMQTFHKLGRIINGEQLKKTESSKLNRSRTHTYALLSQKPEDQVRYHLSDEEQFPPKIVKQIYERRLASSGQNMVEYHFGNLEKSGFMYFSVDKTLILIKTCNFLQSQESEQPITVELDKHALSVNELIIADLNIEDMQRHPFGQKSHILILSFQWQFQFFSYQPRALVKIQDLNLKFNSSCEAVFLMDYCKAGNLYYLSESGEMGRVQLFHSNKANLFKIGKRFGIKEHFFKFQHNTKRKHDKIPNLLSFGAVKQFYNDFKYYWSQKKTKGMSITCDRQRNYLFTLVETSVKNQYNLNRLENQSHREIRIYNICRSREMSLLGKIQSYFYSHPPQLILQITEQKLYTQIGVHLFENLNLQKFQVAGIHIPKPANFSKHKNQTNLILILTNGSRLHLYVSQTKLLLNQHINMPNMEEILRTDLSRKDSQSTIITQKQPAAFRLIKYHFQKDGSYAVTAFYRKTIVSMLFSQCVGTDNTDREEVVVLWRESAQAVRQGSLNGNIFLNFSDFKVYASREFHLSTEKKTLDQYKNIQPNNADAFLDYNKNQNMPQNFRKYQKQTPESRQALHYPYQHLFIQKDKLRLAVKLRPIDILLGTIQKELNYYSSSNNLQQLTSSEYSLNNLVKEIYFRLNIQKDDQKNYKTQLLAMLAQVYCDIDGAYYFQQFSIGDHRRSKERMIPVNVIGQKTTLSTMPNDSQPDRREKDGFTDERTPRFSEKIKTINAFRKFRHSDLCTSHNFLRSHQYASNSIKVRSDSSMMKLIERIICFMIHPQINEKQVKNFDRKLDEGQWVSSKQHLEEISTSDGQQGILIYLSRIIAPIWSLKIRLIKNCIFLYITQICKKILQLLESFESSSTVLSTFPKSFHELQRFCGNIIQYNSMLSVLSVPADVCYSEGLGKEGQMFEQSIFYSLQKRKDFSAAVDQWRQSFPYYFNLKLLKAVKLQAEIALTPKREDKREIVIKNSALMPHYLLYWYCKDGTLSKKEFSSLFQTGLSQAEASNLKNVNHLLITDQMNPESKIQYALEQIKKTSLNLSEKQFLITYALQNIENARSLQSGEILKKKKELEQLQHIIKIQLMISKELQAYEKQNPSQLISQKSKYLVNFVIMNPSQLQSLVQQLKNPMISLIFSCCFSTAGQNFQKLLRQLAVDSQQKIVNSAKIKERLTQIFQIFSKNITNRLPLSPLLMFLDQIACNQISRSDLTYFLSRSDQFEFKKTFWVPIFLSSQGWSQLMILDHYTEQTRCHYLNCELRTQKKFMYYWLSTYAFVKFVYSQGRRTFQIFNESISSIYPNPRENLKQLTRFLQEQLKY